MNVGKSAAGHNCLGVCMFRSASTGVSVYQVHTFNHFYVSTSSYTFMLDRYLSDHTPPEGMHAHHILNMLPSKCCHTRSKICSMYSEGQEKIVPNRYFQCMLSTWHAMGSATPCADLITHQPEACGDVYITHSG